MSPRCGSVCLLVLLGVLVASGGPVHLVSVESITDLLGLKQVGHNHLINSVIINSCQRREEVRLMNATLDVYMRIFSSILQHKQHAKNTKKSPSLLDLCEVSPDKRPQVESVLTEFQQKAAELKRQLSQRINNKEDVLGKLHQIKVDDPDTQRRALAQFLEVSHVASALVSTKCGPAHSSPE